jgi:hypothetical protein
MSEAQKMAISQQAVDRVLEEVAPAQAFAPPPPPPPPPQDAGAPPEAPPAPVEAKPQQKAQQVVKSKLSAPLHAYREAKRVSEIDLERVPFATRGGWGGRKEEARQSLPKLLAAYQEVLEKLAFSVWVEGEPEHVQAFVEKSRSRQLLCMDTLALYRQLGARAIGSIGVTRIFGASQLAQLVNDVREFIFDHKEVDDSKRPEPHLDDLEHVKDDEAALEYVRKIMRRSSGDILNKVHLRKNLSSLALDIGYEQPVVPVVFYGFGSEEEKKELKFLPNEDFAVVVTAESSTDEGHLKILNELKTELRKRRSSKKQ